MTDDMSGNPEETGEMPASESDFDQELSDLVAQGAAQPSFEESESQRLRAESASHLDDLRRLKAEFENYKKRIVRDQSAIVERASIGVVEKLLPVLDDFELALLAADRTQDYDSIVRGVELVFGKLQEVLRTEGVRKIEAEGEKFDPEQHEAVMQAEGSAEGVAVVAEVFRNGYTLNGKVIRPAMVKVARQ